MIMRGTLVALVLACGPSLANAEGVAASPTASCDIAPHGVDFAVQGLPSQGVRPLSFGQALRVAIPRPIGAKLAGLEVWVDTTLQFTIGGLELQSFPVEGAVINVPFTLSITRDPNRPLQDNQTYSLQVKQAAASKVAFVLRDTTGGCGSNEVALKMGAIDTYALVLGFNYSTSQHSLKYAGSDAEAVVSHLVNQLKVRPENVWLLTDLSSPPATSVSIGVNRPKVDGPQSIGEALAQILRKADNQSRLFIYFSGHIFVQQGTSDGLFAKSAAYLMLPDSDIANPYSALKRADLMESIQSLPLASIVLIMDACYSGTVRTAYASDSLRYPTGPKAAGQLLQPIVEEDRTPRGARLTSSDGSSPSWEFDEIQHGVFTYYMINAGKNNPQVTLLDAFMEAKLAMSAFKPQGWTKPLSQTPKDAWGDGGTGIPWRISPVTVGASTQ